MSSEHGSKDFYYYSQQKKYWAECKNYASNIDLKVLASILIMAQLSEIDTILYYSYSAINVNAKAKLLLNANKKGKTIYFYDDTVLEQKIFQYWDCVGEEFFPEFSKENMKFEKLEYNYETTELVTGGFFCVEKFVTPYTNEKGVCPWSTQEKNEITTPATGA